MRVGFVGAGKMAEAILAALIRSGTVPAGNIVASDVSSERRQFIRKKYGIHTTALNSDVPKTANIIFLAVKPQQLSAVLGELQPVTGSAHLVISIAAGKRITTIESALPKARVVRVMPNLACTVGHSMSVFCTGRRTTSKDKATTTRILSCFGKVLELPETKFDAVTALSGSGPAFFAYFMQAMADAGEKEGLSRKHAQILAEQTMLGTAFLLIHENISPETLIASVASAKGTTAAGLSVLESSDLCRIVRRTLKAATRRSRELRA